MRRFLLLLVLVACSSESSDATTSGGGNEVPCITCREFFEQDTAPDFICRGEAEVALNGLVGCTCSTCRTDCLDSACQAGTPSAACMTCLETMCSSEIDACLMN